MNDVLWTKVGLFILKAARFVLACIEASSWAERQSCFVKWRPLSLVPEVINLELSGQLDEF